MADEPPVDFVPPVANAPPELGDPPVLVVLLPVLV
jgi:hypothetical protein